MDPTLIEAQVAEAEAALSAGQGSWAAYEAQMLNLVRTIEDEISTAQTRLEQQKGQRDSDVAKLAELRVVQTRRDELFKNRLIGEVEAAALRPEIAWLEKTVEAYPAVIARCEQTLERRQRDRQDVRQSLRLAPDEDVQKAIVLKTGAQVEMLRSALEMRQREREAYSLRAPTDGVVSEIGAFPGSVVAPGVRVVRIVSPSRLITGYLPEVRRGRVRIGDCGYAFRLTQPPVKVRVVAVAPEIEPIPVAVRPTTAAQQSGVTFRAQRIVFETEGPPELTAGESVQIRLTSEWWARARYRLGLRW
jgi:multidrug resistance efflux pump